MCVICDRYFGNYDQSMQFAWLIGRRNNKLAYVTWASKASKGKINRQNERRTCTTIACPLYSFKDKSIKYGTMFLILKSKTNANAESKAKCKRDKEKRKKQHDTNNNNNNNDINITTNNNNNNNNISLDSSIHSENARLRASEQLQSNLEKVGLQVGYNRDENMFIDTSTNGWDQEYLLPAQINEIIRSTAGKPTVMQLDNWSSFDDYQLWIKPLLEACIFPC